MVDQKEDQSIPVNNSDLMINQSNLTIKEINFLLGNLKDLLATSSMTRSEEDLAIFLIDQLKKIKQAKESGQSNEDKGKMNLESQDKKLKPKDKKNRSYLKKLLNKKLGEFIIINLMIGGDCCQIKGVLCSIEKDFITLIFNDQILYIKITVIASIQKKVSSFNDDKNNCKSKKSINKETKRKFDNSNENYQLNSKINDHSIESLEQTEIKRQEKTYNKIKE